MSDLPRTSSRFLQTGNSAPSVLGPTPASSVLQSDINSSTWSSYFTTSSSASSGPPASDDSAALSATAPTDAFPFPHLGLRKQQQTQRHASYQSIPSASLSVSRHWSVPIVTSNKGGGRATPLLDLALCPAQASEPTEAARHVAVVSRSTLKIMNMRPPKQTFASAAASSVNRRDSSSSSGHSATSKSAATELLDVKAGTRLSRHFFTSVTWGYNASSNQLATGGTDGVVMLWDVAMQNTAKSQDRLVHKRAHHDRSVNQVAFAGPSGVWLISAGQDGSIKLWDTRLRAAATGDASQLTLDTHADPVRALAVHPVRSAPQLFQLCSLNESGALTHWDIRSSRTHQSRNQAHLGLGLGIDWVERLPDDGDISLEHLYEIEHGESLVGKNNTWIATCGMDSTVKVFPFSDTFSSKPVATLHTSAPASRVRWRTDQAAELAVVPLPSQSNSPNANRAESTAPNLTNEIEIWDLRRPHVPKCVVRSGLGGVSAFACAPVPDSNLIWATHRDSGVLAQHDLAFDAQRPLSNFPKASLAWSPAGELAFSNVAVEPPSMDNDEAEIEAPVQVSAAIQTESSQALSTTDLIQFARHAKVKPEPSLSEACRHNAKLARDLQCSDLHVSWLAMASLFGPHDHVVASLGLDAPDAPTPAAPEQTGESLFPLRLATGGQRQDGVRHYTYQYASAASPMSAASSTSKQRLEHSRSMSRQSRRPSTPKALADFTEESSASAAEEDGEELVASSTLTAVPPTDTRTVASHFSQHDHDEGFRSDHQRTSQRTLTLSKTIRNAVAHGRIAAPPSSRPPLSARALSFHGQTSTTRAITPTHVDRYSSSESDVNTPVAGPRDDSPGGSIKGKRDVRASVDAALPSSAARLSRSRTRRGPNLAIDHSKAMSQQSKSLYKPDLVSGSLPSMSIKRERDLQLAIERHDAAIKDSTEAHSHLWLSLHDQLADTLQDMTDQGHLQLAVQLMQLLRPSLSFDAMFVARCEVSYLEILRRLELHQVATAIAKSSSSDAVKESTDANTTFHTACGSCGKALLSAPFDRCARCTAAAVVCAVCRKSGGLHGSGCDFLHCATCGHAAHVLCLDNLTAAAQDSSRPSARVTSQCASGCGHVTCPLAFGK